MTVSEMQHEGQTHAAANLFAAVGAGIYDKWATINVALIGAMFASKADIRQNKDAANQVSRELNCRQPEDFIDAHDEMEEPKGPNGKMTYDQLLEIWRKILCGGGE